MSCLLALVDKNLELGWLLTWSIDNKMMSKWLEIRLEWETFTRFFPVVRMRKFYDRGWCIFKQHSSYLCGGKKCGVVDGGCGLFLWSSFFILDGSVCRWEIRQSAPNYRSSPSFFSHRSRSLPRIALMGGFSKDAGVCVPRWISTVLA